MSAETKYPSQPGLPARELKHLQMVLMLVGSIIVVLLMAMMLMAGLGSGSIRTLLILISGIAGLVIALAVFVRPELGAFILIFTIFTNLSDILVSQGFPSLNKPLVVLISISLILNYFFRQRSNFRLQRTEILLGLFAVVSGLTFLVAVDTNLVVEWTVDLAKDIIILMAIVYALHSSKTWNRAYWILVLSASAIALLGFYQVVSVDYSTQFFGLAKVHFDSSVANGFGAARLQGPIDDPNFYGQMMVAVLPLAIYSTLSATSRAKRLLAAIASLLIGSAIIFSYSRGAFLAFAFVLVVVLFTRVRSWPNRLLAISLALPLFALLPSGYLARLETLVSLRPADGSALYQENSFRGRSSEMQAGLLMWRDHPLLGVGAENFPVLYQEYASRIGLEYRNEDRQAHSLYVQILAETGIIGAGLFVGFLISLFTSMRRNLHRLNKLPGSTAFASSYLAIQVGIGAYLITSIFLHADYSRYLILMISLAIAANHLIDRAFSEKNAMVSPTAQSADER